MTNENFFENVIAVVKQVPKGRVTSYGAIAAYLGVKSSSRMVGWALHNSISSKSKVPAHRVLNRNGLLTGKAHFGNDRMQKLLEAEGHIIENDELQNFMKVFWDPSKELAL